MNQILIFIAQKLMQDNSSCHHDQNQKNSPESFSK